MKGDRFEKLTYRPEGWHEQQSMESIEQWAAKLLRTEHAAVKRMVKAEMVEVAGPIGRAHNQCVERIPAALDRRAKGKGGSHV